MISSSVAVDGNEEAASTIEKINKFKNIIATKKPTIVKTSPEMKNFFSKDLNFLILFGEEFFLPYFQIHQQQHPYPYP